MSLQKAYDNFFAGRANCPQYKKKGKAHESFYLSNDKFTVGSHWIAMPGLGRFILGQRKQRSDRGKLRRTLGTVNLAETLRFVEEGKAPIPTNQRKARKQVGCERVKILGATVSCEAGHWYVSLQVEIKRERPPPPSAVVGVDVGLKQAAVVSDGRRLENQRPLALHLGKLGKLQRQLSRKQKTKDPETKRTVFSKNYEKQRLKVARKHQQIATMRRDVQHKFTTELARTCGVIGIEDLNILGMLANRKLARAVADAAMGHLVQFLKTKVATAGGELCIASRWFPSRHPLFVLRACQETHAAQTPHLSVPDLWASDRPGLERRFEPGLVRGRNASPASCVKLAVLGSGYDRDVKCLWSRCETETRGLIQRFSCHGCRR